MALPTNQEIDNAIRTSNTGTDADRPIRLSTNELLKAFRQEIANTQQDLANKVNSSTFNALAQVARTGNYNDINGRPQQYGGAGQNTDGYMTQKAVTDELGNKADLVGGKVPFEQLPSSLASGVVFKGTWDAATNQDNNGNPLPATPINDGEYYIVNTAGTQFGLTFAAGDWIIAVDGQWYKLEPDSTVSSVNGQTGAVVIDVGVTSVGVTVPTGLVVANTPITSAGTIDIELAEGYKIPTQSELEDKGIEPPVGWLEAGNETKYLAGDGTLKDIPSDTQSDYAQTNPNAPDYIKNKPELFSGSYDDLEGKPTIPTKTSQLENDSEFITDASLADLEARVDAALTKTFTPWQPEVIEGSGSPVNFTTIPDLSFGGGYSQNENVFTFSPIEVAPDDFYLATWKANVENVPEKYSITFNKVSTEPNAPVYGYYNGVAIGNWDPDNEIYPTVGFNYMGPDGNDPTLLVVDNYMGDSIVDPTKTLMNADGQGVITAPPPSQGVDVTLAIDNSALSVSIFYDGVLKGTVYLLEPLIPESIWVSTYGLVSGIGQTATVTLVDRAVEDYIPFTIYGFAASASAIDETKYPQSREGKGYEIIGLAQPAQWNELGKEVKNGDFIVFDNAGVPVLMNEEPTVVQEAGDSEAAVMSQKAVTVELDNKAEKVQAKEIVTANKTLTAADSGKLLIINADGITITMPASSDFNIDIAKMDEGFTTIVQSAGTDKFREGTDTISVIRDVSITNSGIVGKEWLAIGAYEA